MRWDIEAIDGGLRLSRGGRRAMHFAAETRLPDAPMAQVARSIRQDVWRALRRLRGFSPVVELRRDAFGLHVRAGGCVLGRVPPGAAEIAGAVLESPSNRTRWVNYARRCNG